MTEPTYWLEDMMKLENNWQLVIIWRGSEQLAVGELDRRVDEETGSHIFSVESYEFTVDDVSCIERVGKIVYLK